MRVRNPLGLIAFVLLAFLVFSYILEFVSRDYITTLTSEKSTEVPSPAPLPQETASVRIVENPDGSKNVFVEASVNIGLSSSVSGQVFDSSKYENYITAKEMRKETSELLKNIWDEYSDGIRLFITVLSIPLALVAFIKRGKYG